MASILKNQILKHLSKFTKNLSLDKINLSTLKGEGELTNLELDENILMELLDLPTWMRLSKAVCNRVAVKIQWTKLKSQPICLILDEVLLEMETCEVPRSSNDTSDTASYRSGGKYGFVDRVIDGIYVHINSVNVTFRSKTFQATLQLSRVRVQSVTPTWQKAPDLRKTRIRDTGRDEILVFKEVDWQTTRIEAEAVIDDKNNGLPPTPLRFIANQSKIRIGLKKNLSDCSIISSRVILLLDDLLWVLTDTQLKAAILYVKSLKEVIEKSSEQSKKLAAEKLKKQGQLSPSGSQRYFQRPQTNVPGSSIDQLFAKFDIQTTSYHLITGRIDLHLCDDSSPDTGASPKHNNKIEGGAMQITLFKLSVDHYPFHPADEDLIMTSGGERKQWYRYTDNLGSRNHWVQLLFAAFKKDVSNARGSCSSTPTPNHSPSHQPNSQSHTPEQQSSPSHAPSRQTLQVQGQPVTKPSRPKSTKLVESCFVLKVEEFIIYRVSTSDQKRGNLKKFFSSDKKQLHLPPDMSVIHMEYTDYYFTEGIDYPVPHANMYILINPVRLTVDYLTLLWLNFFMLNLAQTVDLQGEMPTVEHIDCKIEAVMPRSSLSKIETLGPCVMLAGHGTPGSIHPLLLDKQLQVILQAEHKIEGQPDRPDSMQLQISKLAATNCRVEQRCTREDLLQLLENYSKAELLFSDVFPNDGQSETIIPSIFNDHAQNKDNPYIEKYVKDLVMGIMPVMENLPDKVQFFIENGGTFKEVFESNSLKWDALCDIWTVTADQVWLEFLGVPTPRSRPAPFVESFPLTFWLSIPNAVNNKKDRSNSAKCQFVNSEENAQSEYRRNRDLLKKYYSVDEEDTSENIKIHCDTDNEIQNSSDDTSLENCAQCEKNNSDFYVIVNIGAKIRAQLNHFQYLFLFRQIDMFSEFKTQLTADFERYAEKVSSPVNPLTFCVPLIVPDIEFAVITTLSSDAVSSIVTSPSSPGLTLAALKNFSNQEIEQFYNINDFDGDTLTEMSTDKGELERQGSGNSHSTPSTIENNMAERQNDKTLPSEPRFLLDGDMSTDFETIPKAVLIENQNDSDIDSASHNLSTEIHMQRPLPRKQSKSENVKKAFSTAMTNFTDKLKNITDQTEDGSTYDDADTSSIKTDFTDDDDDFEHMSLEDEELPAFGHGGFSETASSADTVSDTQDNLSIYAESTVSARGKAMVAVTLFNVKRSEAIIQSYNDNVVLRAQFSHLNMQQVHSIVYEDFFIKFSTPSGYIQEEESTVVSSTKYPIKLKFIIGPEAEQMETSAGERGLLQLLAEKISLSFKMSGLVNLTDFIEDEKLSEPLPMKIDLTDIHIRLQEDRPPRNISSPGPVPMDIGISKLYISVAKDGVYNISGAANDSALQITSIARDLKSSSTNVPLNPEKAQDKKSEQVETVEYLRKENEKLKKQVALSLSKSGLDNKSLNIGTSEQEIENLKLKNKELQESLNILTQSKNGNHVSNDLESLSSTLEIENLKLQEKVAEMEDDLFVLNKEKESLVATLKLLQEELLVNEKRCGNSSPRT